MGRCRRRWREVLDDPVYVDRVEWEHAHRFLRSDSKFDYVYDDNGDGPLEELAERFGWDLSDEDGWGRLDFQLLETSYDGGNRSPAAAPDDGRLTAWMGRGTRGGADATGGRR
ncbi:hypothetical protein ZWY2020_005333 [Hordeum vulgare]|nr:hypothetical protein ZWY2020_005333 [Hordeum vulgare]